MNCNRCGRENEIDSNFCKNCEQQFKYDLKINFIASTDPNYTIFNSEYVVSHNTDLGYLIISLIIAFNLFTWLAWSFVGRNIGNEYRLGLSILQVLSAFFLVSQFIVMFLFTKRANYKITIGIIGAFVLLSQIYNIINVLSYMNR